MLYVPVDVVLFVFPVTFVHVPLTSRLELDDGVCDPGAVVVLRVPLIVKGCIDRNCGGFVPAESCVGIVFTVHVHEWLVEALICPIPA